MAHRREQMFSGRAHYRRSGSHERCVAIEETSP
ncbi:hypothetical protein SAMN05421810_102578 [Amycolatopsis arida]|uniref:Uncharacterized protein n=1 Tax=Amycolatopsis arida TaxID=587909 RepID=A0A1I5QCN7_9PSEU|nr:hypothetical protein CLV69_101579 [Amycolatopsis arida]SFP43636.1 hypothetical protein SAMN05421810_102578 [Amycolatopsis arida]